MYLSSTTKSDQNNVSPSIYLFINLVTPKVRAKHEPFFNEPASGSLLTSLGSYHKTLYVWNKLWFVNLSLTVTFPIVFYYPYNTMKWITAVKCFIMQAPGAANPIKLLKVNLLNLFVCN